MKYFQIVILLLDYKPFLIFLKKVLLTISYLIWTYVRKSFINIYYIVSAKNSYSLIGTCPKEISLDKKLFIFMHITTYLLLIYISVDSISK